MVGKIKARSVDIIGLWRGARHCPAAILNFYCVTHHLLQIPLRVVFVEGIFEVIPEQALICDKGATVKHINTLFG